MNDYIEIIKNPNPISFTGNKIQFELLSNDIYVQNGVREHWSTSISAKMVDADTMTISYDNVNLEWEFIHPNADYDNNELIADDGTMTVLEWKNLLWEGLMANKTLSRDWLISSNETTYTIHFYRRVDENNFPISNQGFAKKEYIQIGGTNGQGYITIGDTNYWLTYNTSAEQTALDFIQNKESILLQREIQVTNNVGQLIFQNISDGKAILKPTFSNNSGDISGTYTANYNFVINYYSTHSPSKYKYSNTTYPIIKDIYKINIGLFNKFDFTKIANFVISVNMNKTAITNIHNYIKNYLTKKRLETNFNFPDSSSIYITLRNNHSLNFYITYNSQWGLPQENKHLLKSNTYTAILGGFNKETLNFIKQADTNGNDSKMFIDSHQFLSFQPIQKHIAPTQKEQLYFFAPLTTKYYFKASITYTDNSIEYIEIDNWNATKGNVYELNCSPSKNGINAKNTTKTIKKFKLKVYTLNGSGTENWRTLEMQYIIDYNVYEFERFFLIRNSLGGYDTIRLTGKQIQQNNYSRNTYSKNLPRDFNAIPEIINTRGTEKQKFNIVSGFKTKEEIDHYREFLLSEELYIMKTETILLPINIITSETTPSTDGEYIKKLKLDYSIAYKDNFYSYFNQEANF